MMYLESERRQHRLWGEGMFVVVYFCPAGCPCRKLLSFFMSVFIILYISDFTSSQDFLIVVGIPVVT